MKLLNTVRTPKNNLSTKKQIFFTVGIFLFGIGLGTFSKYLDHQQAYLPSFLMMIDNLTDLHNFLGRFSPWIFIAVCISVYSQSPTRAAVNVLSFFVGMVSSYYLYSNFIAGFFPKSYAMIWIAFTALSPFLAYLCWYAKGNGWIACIISACIIGTLFNTAFSYGFFYFSVRYWLEVIVFLLMIAILHRKSKEMFVMLGSGIVFAVITNFLLPLPIW